MFSYLKWEKNLLQELVGEQVEFSKILIKMKNCIIFVYRDLLSKCSKNAVLGRQDMWCSANMFYDTKATNSLKICKIRKIFGCVMGACYFQCRVRRGLFGLSGLSGKIQKYCMSERIFPKKNSKYEILDYLYFSPNFVFQGWLQGTLASLFLFLILHLLNHTLKKL